MAGVPIRNAFATELAAVCSSAGITWTIKDVINVFATADGLTNFLCLEFPPGPPPVQSSFGNPGNDYWREEGQVLVRLVAPLNSGRATIEDYAFKIFTAFLGRHFAKDDGCIIHTAATSPEGGEFGARWIETVSVSFRTNYRG